MELLVLSSAFYYFHQTNLSPHQDQIGRGEAWLINMEIIF